MSNNLNTINWERIKVVIFDVDGTLYTQSKLRKRMLFDLVTHYVLRPWKISELKILYHFRQEREVRAFASYESLETAQYEWCAEKSKSSISAIQKVVDKWIFSHPNKYLSTCVFPGTKELFKRLKEQGVKIAIYSDYKAADKLKAMQLQADIVVSSTDPEVNKLKPHPQGLLFIAKKIGVDVSECLFIGDREEKDGLCAKNAGMPYLILEKQPFESFNFYTKLLPLIPNLNKQNRYESSLFTTKL